MTIIVAVLGAAGSGFSLLLMLSRVPNMHIIFYIVLGVSILLVTISLILTLDAYEKRRRLARALRRCFLVCLTLGLSGFLVLQGLIMSSAQTEDAQVDAIIVLGAGLRNSTPSMILRTRLNAALQYLETRGDVVYLVARDLTDPGEGDTAKFHLHALDLTKARQLGPPEDEVVERNE